MVLDAQGRKVAELRADGPIESVVSDGRDGWYVAGAFSDVGEGGLARVGADGRFDPRWRAEAETEDLVSMAVGHGRLYVTGVRRANGLRRHGAAAFDAGSGDADRRWDAPASGGDGIAAGDRVFHADVDRVDSLDPVTAAPDRGFRVRAEPPTEGPQLRVVALAGRELYLGGRFLTVNGARRVGVAAVDARTGTLDAGWQPPVLDSGPCQGCNGDVMALTLGGGRLFAFGGFSRAGGAPTRGGLVALDAATGAATGFHAPRPGPSPDGGEGTYEEGAVLGDGLFVVGDFGSNDTHGFVLLDARTGSARASWHPAKRHALPLDVAASGDRVLVVGDGLAP